MSLITFSDYKGKYRFDCLLSKGSFGRVCRIKEIATMKLMALKKISAHKKEELEDAQNEIKFLNQFRHPYVVEIKETYIIEIRNGLGKPISEIGIVMELATCSLQQIIRNRKPMVSESFLTQQALGFIEVLSTLQEENIAHRDIKPGNILVFENSDNTQRWKLADFGISCNMDQHRDGETFAGTYEYASPKLKRKFSCPTLKLKTNSFKDDVYSLGVTLLETITFEKTFCEKARLKLHESCENKKFVALIEMMLEDEEENRPCFKTLMKIVKEEFQHKEIVADGTSCEASEKANFFPVCETKSANLYSDETFVEKMGEKVKIVMNNFGKSICSTEMIDGHIMCGNEKGDIFFVRGEEIIECGKVHESRISQILNDEKGNLWTIGDKIAKKWLRANLINGLKSEVKESVLSKKKPFRKHDSKRVLSLDMAGKCEEFELTHFHPCGASYFYIKDEKNMAIGFFNGFVYVKWDGKEYHNELFSKPITGIIPSENEANLIMCSLDGQIKSIRTCDMKLNRRFYSENKAEFFKMKEDKDTITLHTIDGREIIVDENLCKKFENTISKKKVLDFIENKENCYTLTLDGEILNMNSEVLVALEGNKWSCLLSKGKHEMVACSYDGSIASISW